MYRRSEEAKRAAKLHALLNNGDKFAIMPRTEDKILSTCRYEWQAKARKKWGERIIPIDTLL